jgi:D-serine deaminase-like pyridoxal phosphate-dependent protein
MAAVPHPGRLPVLATVPTPALLVDYRVLTRNIREMAQRAARHGVTLWPHAKTHKTPQIAALQRQHGAAGVTVATVAEAEAMVRHGAGDLLVAYPPVGTWRTEALVRLAGRARVRAVTDDPGVLRALEDSCRQAGVTVGYLWEVDSGAGRLGSEPGAVTADLITRAGSSRWTPFEGLMTFAGHVYRAAGPDEVPVIAAAEAAAVLSTAAALADRGIEAAALSTGTTPTAHHLDQQRGITEARPGNYVFHDATQVALGVAGPGQCALSVLATVVGRPDPRRIILDAGSKALAADRMTPLTPGFGFIAGHPDLVVRQLYEEHAIVHSPEPSAISVGARLRVVPNHACAAANLHRRMFVVDGPADGAADSREDGAEIADVWPVAPGSGGQHAPGAGTIT